MVEAIFQTQDGKKIIYLNLMMNIMKFILIQFVKVQILTSRLKVVLAKEMNDILIKLTKMINIYFAGHKIIAQTILSFICQLCINVDCSCKKCNRLLENPKIHI